MKYDSKEWHEQIGLVIDAIGSNKFPDELIRAIKKVVPYNQIVIICYKNDVAPVFWHSQVPENRKAAVINQYLNGCYLLDPWYHAFLKGMNDGLFFLEDVAPDDFFVSEFYREYYREIKIENEAVLNINLRRDLQIQISMGIMEKEITQETRNNLSIIFPFIKHSAIKHWAHHPNLEAQENSSIIHRHVSYVFNNFGQNVLSDREREVALLIIRGYSFKAISDVLGLAFGTVKVHCKNMYRKLEINSQSELFSLFIDEINASSPENS